VEQYKKGIYTLNDFILKSRVLSQEYKNQANVSKEMKNMYNELDRAATKYWLDVEKGAAAERAAIKESLRIKKAEHLVEREKQQIRAALNRLQREVTSGATKKDLNSEKAYNAVLKQQIELYNARRISAQEFMNITNRMMEQEKNYANLSNAEMKKVEDTRQRAISNLRRQERETAKLNEQQRMQQTGLAGLNRGIKGYLSNMGMIVKKFADWILVAQLIFLPIRVFQEAVTYVREMDDALTDLNKVVELSKSQLDDMRIAAIELGKELGVSSSEIAKGMAEFGRITKVKEDIIDLAKAAAVAANVTTMSADEAAKAINTTLITFKKDLSEAMSLVDMFNEIQNNYRTSAEDLANSIGKVGAAARQAGTDIENLAGYTTAIVSATGVTGSVAGTALTNFLGL
jgi:hypothetical protein